MKFENVVELFSKVKQKQLLNLIKLMNDYNSIMSHVPLESLLTLDRPKLAEILLTERLRQIKQISN